MRAVVFEEKGGEEVLELRDIPVGTPGKGEVLVKLTSVGLNRADLLFPQGLYFTKPAFATVSSTLKHNPASRAVSRLGFEGAGRITAIGENSRYQIGERVAFINFDNVSEQGCLAEFAIVAEKNILPTPASVSDEQAGAIWIQYLTAWGGLIADGELKHNQTVAITAASNSVGLACIQIAKLKEARVIATTTSDDKIEALYDAGADLVLNLERADYVEEVRRFTKGIGTDLVFDAVAGPGIRHLIQGSKKRGKIIIQGMLDRRPMEVHPGVLMKRQLTLKGFVIGHILETPALVDKAVTEISKGLNENTLNPVIGGVFPLESFPSAFRLLKSGRHLGKIVIAPKQTPSASLPD